MAAPLRTPRELWIEEALHLLAAEGASAIQVEPIAKRLGVTKGGFYWHFRDRQALVAEVLATWERTFIDHVITTVEAGGGDARTRLRQLFRLAADDDLMAIELAVRDWARRDATVAAHVARVDNRRMGYLRELFQGAFPGDDSVEARCLLALTLFVGNGFVTARHGSTSRSAVTRRALQLLLS